MTDSMKFGPEWIRTLSESGGLGLAPQPSSSGHSCGAASHHGPPQLHGPTQMPQVQSMPPSVRYTLAEHRYGREEMLALYSSSLGPPESLKSLAGLYVEKSQQPLALFSFTDEELRIWNRGVNPDGLGRGGGGGKGSNDGSVRGRRDGAGREGRGRGRGGGTPGTYFSRPPGPGPMTYPGDPQGDSGAQAQGDTSQHVPFNRGRPPFDRQGSERSWSERNGGSGGGGENSSRGRMGGGDTNWRRHRVDSEESNSLDPSVVNSSAAGLGGGPWRPPTKWQHPAGRNWRDEDSWNDRDPRMSNHNLPEWAMEKNEGGGSFDASGAFHGHDQDDDMPMPRRRERSSHHDQKSKSESSDTGDGSGLDLSSERMHDIGDKEMDQDRPDRKREEDAQGPGANYDLDEIKKHVEKHLMGDERALKLSEIKRQLELLEKQQAAKLQSPEGDPASSKEGHSQQPAAIQQSQLPEPQQMQPQNQPIQPPVQQIQQAPVQQQMPVIGQPPPVQQMVINQPPMSIQQNAIMVDEDQSQVHHQSQSTMMGVGMSQHQSVIGNSPNPQVHQPLNTLARLHQGPPNPPNQIIHDSHLDDHSINDNIATDLVAKLMEEEEKRDKQWYYKDPQGQVQGPFSCGEMAEWFQSGYFSLGLMVKRACDPSFSPLGELIKIWGSIPFLTDQPPGGNPLQAPPLGQVPQMQHPEKEVPAPGQQPQQPNPIPEAVLHQMKMDQYRQHQQQMLLRQQQHQHQQQQQHHQAMTANRNQVKMPGAYDWPDHLSPPQHQEGQQTTGGQQASQQLKNLLAQMQAQAQAHQQMKQQQQQQTSRPKEMGSNVGGGGGGAVMETLMSLHQQQVAQQAALHQALLAETQGPNTGASSIRSIVSQMIQGKLRVNSQPANIESVWNGGDSWKHWSQVNPKAFKTEQQVLEEQMRAEDERKREEMRKQEGAVSRISEEESKDRKRDKMEEKAHNDRNKREQGDDLQRRRTEEEELRRKQEAVRRAEVERQRKEEDKRKKEEDKRRKDEDKRKQQEERERLKLEDDRKKKEAEEAKKRQDLMNKIQRDQWCPPQASNISLLDIQRLERQQAMRMIREQQEAAEAVAAVEKTNMRLKWTENQRSAPFLVESLADIQAQQYRQLIKLQEKEKVEREKKEAASGGGGGVNQQVGGTWSQGLNWSSLSHSQQPVWHSSSSQGGGGVGFWDQLSGSGKPSQPANNPVGSKVVAKHPHPQQVVSGSGPHQQQVVSGAGPHQQQKENKSKAKREEMAVMQLFGGQTQTQGPVRQQDDFTKWCHQTLATLPMSSPIDIPTFISFLREIESSPEIFEYVRGYVGESKEATEFARQFVEKRHGLVQQSAPHPAHAALSQQSLLSEDFQQVKSKGKNKKKGRVNKMPVDPRILGFSSTASPDRINVGDREYPEDL